MRFLKKVALFYIDGFRALTLGKVLWKVIIIKLFVIFIGLKIIVYDKSLSHLGDNESKSGFVIDNLIVPKGERNGNTQ